VGQLQTAFKDMSSMLTAIMGQIGHASEQLAASSQQLNASAEESTQGANQVAQTVAVVAKGATEQVEVINRTLEGIHQINDAINDIANDASIVAGVSGEAARVAHDGEKSIGYAVDTMANINNTVQDTAKVIRNLGVASTQISEIVDTFQVLQVIQISLHLMRRLKRQGQL